jgi:hypothetical protein
MRAMILASHKSRNLKKCSYLDLCDVLLLRYAQQYKNIVIIEEIVKSIDGKKKLKNRNQLSKR